MLLISKPDGIVTREHGAKNAKNGLEAEPKEVEHGGEVIADRILILLFSKADGTMTRHNVGG